MRLRTYGKNFGRVYLVDKLVSIPTAQPSGRGDVNALVGNGADMSKTAKIVHMRALLARMNALRYIVDCFVMNFMKTFSHHRLLI
jgi:hypothetical protein